MCEIANRLDVPVILASEKMMERGRVDLDPSMLVVGTVPFVTLALRHLGHQLPEHEPYPEVLVPWLHRRVWLEPELLKVLDSLDREGKPLFIKPAKGWKRFTGFVAQFRDDYRFQGVSKHAPVWVSEPIEFVSEWRAYVVHGEIRAIKFAKHGGDRTIAPDTKEIEDAVMAMVGTGQAPAGFVIDFGVTDNGETALVEVNDGFAFGAYDGLDAQIYWDLTAARWFELVGGQKHRLAELG